MHVFLPLTARWRTVSRLRDTAAAALPASPLLPPTHLLSHRKNKQRTENRTKKEDRRRENKQWWPSAVHVSLPLTVAWRPVSRLRETAAAALPASPLLPPTHLLSHSKQTKENREQDKEGRQKEREQAVVAVCCACVPASDCGPAPSQPAQRNSSPRPSFLPSCSSSASDDPGTDPVHFAVHCRVCSVSLCLCSLVFPPPFSPCVRPAPAALTATAEGQEPCSSSSSESRSSCVSSKPVVAVAHSE